MKTGEKDAGAQEAAIPLFAFYAYGYRGRFMYAVRSPFPMPGTGEGLVGRVAGIEGKLYRVLGIWRQLDGAIAAGEPIGVEVLPSE